MNTADLHRIFLSSSGISTDTRSIEPANLFFALKGDNFNANEFAKDALAKGAAHAVIDDPAYDDSKGQYIVVEDSLQSLQDLARFHREYLGIPIVAITGSNGKTTTKELCREVLSTTFKVKATTGNLNNHIGVPLTLLSMDESVEIGIVEMGANHLGEIAALCKIVQPDMGYITNFGKAHLEGFGGFEGVIAGKSELYDYLRSANKKIILNLDDPIQQKQQQYKKTYGFASDPRLKPDLQISFIAGEEFAKIQVHGHEISSQLSGHYNALNMAAAVAVGSLFGVELSAAQKAIARYTPHNNRSQIINVNQTTVLLDAYNANPTSMRAALDNFLAKPAPYKVAILGDMFELGRSSEEEHQELVDYLSKSEIDKVILLGKHFFQTRSPEGFDKHREIEGLGDNFSAQWPHNTLVIIKGSRGMALERLIERF